MYGQETAFENQRSDARPGARRELATRIAMGILAATLLTSGMPALAGKPDHGRHGGHPGQTHEREASAAKKGKGNKSKSVTKTFSSDGEVAIPATGSVLDIGPADPYPSTIAVTGFKKARIADVNLTLRGLSHTFPADLDVLLVAPGSRNSILLSDAGRDPTDGSVTNITLTLDDEAAALPVDTRLTSGSFRPLVNEDPSQLDFPSPAPVPSGRVGLSTFDGGAPNGEWQLFILDDGQGDAGRLANGWELQITAKQKTHHKKKH